jgi:hypothetical protein
MDNKHIKVVTPSGNILKISFRKLPDGEWSVVGWGNTVSVRSTDIKTGGFLIEFIDALLYINGEEKSDENIEAVYNAIVDAIN